MSEKIMKAFTLSVALLPTTQSMDYPSVISLKDFDFVDIDSEQKTLPITLNGQQIFAYRFTMNDEHPYYYVIPGEMFTSDRSKMMRVGPFIIPLGYGNIRLLEPSYGDPIIISVSGQAVYPYIPRLLPSKE